MERMTSNLENAAAQGVVSETTVARFCPMRVDFGAFKPRHFL